MRTAAWTAGIVVMLAPAGAAKEGTPGAPSLFRTFQERQLRRLGAATGAGAAQK